MNIRYGHLLRVLGVAFGWAVTVGNTIGAGILRAPGEVAQAVPSVPWFLAMWLAGGAYALLGATNLAELGAMIPKSGGQTVFVQRAFGAYPGFAVAYSDWLSSAASAAAVTIVLVDAVTAIMPAALPYRILFACGVIVFFAAIQWRGVKSGSTVQLVTSVLKALAFLALIAACFLVKPATPVAAGAVTTGTITLAGVVLALQAMVFTYDGWTGALYFSGEVTDPGRDIPRSMISAVLSILLIYLLVNLAFLHLMPLSMMAGDPLVADTASRLVFGPAGTTIIRILIAVSLLSALNAMILITSRVLYAAGARRVNQGGTPTTALGVSTLVALIFAATGTFNQVIAIAAFFFVANYALSFAAVLRLRQREPDTPRPYRAWGYPYSTILMLLISVAFLLAVIAGDPKNGVAGVILLAVSYPIYRIKPKQEV